MLDIDHNGSLGFGQWLLVCITFCLFAEEEVCRYVFYVFDKDKDGYFEEEEMRLLIAILYRLAPDDRLRGNEYRAWRQMEVCEDGRIEPEEFREINRTYPRLFYPAFRLQQNMILHTTGKLWWDVKKNHLQIKRDMKNGVLAGKRKRHKRKLQQRRDRRLRRRMGVFTYYMCFWKRDSFRRKLNDNGKEDLTEEEAKYEEDKAKHQAIEQHIKNPETLEWITYQQRRSTESKQGNIDRTIEISVKQRNQRKIGRRERKQDRVQHLHTVTKGIRIP